MDEPEIREVSVHWGGGGKVQLEGYGKQSSEYSCNITRKYAIPPGWDDVAVAEFEYEVIAEIKTQLEPVLQDEHDERMEARNGIADEG